MLNSFEFQLLLPMCGEPSCLAKAARCTVGKAVVRAKKFYLGSRNPNALFWTNYFLSIASQLQATVA